jgi:hypothetical protein
VIAGILILTIVFLSFRRINKMALKPFALILSLHNGDHHVGNYMEQEKTNTVQ